MHTAVFGVLDFARVGADTGAGAIQGVGTSVLQVVHQMPVILVGVAVAVGPVGPQEGVPHRGFVVRLAGGFEGARVGGRGSGGLVGDVVGKGWHLAV